MLVKCDTFARELFEKKERTKIKIINVRFKSAKKNSKRY